MTNGGLCKWHNSVDCYRPDGRGNRYCIIRKRERERSQAKKPRVEYRCPDCDAPLFAGLHFFGATCEAGDRRKSSESVGRSRV